MEDLTISTQNTVPAPLTAPSIYSGTQPVLSSDPVMSDAHDLLAKITAQNKEYETQLAEYKASSEKIALEHHRLETTRELETNGLPDWLGDHLMGEDFNTTKNTIKKFKKFFNDSVQALVNERLASAPASPKVGNEQTASQGPVKKTHQYGYKELAKMKADNPDMYQKIMKEKGD